MNKIQPQWIDTSEALKLGREFRRGPRTKHGLYRAAKNGRFIRKAFDGLHWEFHRRSVQKYYELCSMTNMTELAKYLKTSFTALKYLALRNQIYHSWELGRKHLSEQDRKRLVKLYKEKIRDKNR